MEGTLTKSNVVKVVSGEDNILYKCEKPMDAVFANNTIGFGTLYMRIKTQLEGTLKLYFTYNHGKTDGSVGELKVVSNNENILTTYTLNGSNSSNEYVYVDIPNVKPNDMIYFYVTNSTNIPIYLVVRSITYNLA